MRMKCLIMGVLDQVFSAPLTIVSVNFTAITKINVEVIIIQIAELCIGNLELSMNFIICPAKNGSE